MNVNFRDLEALAQQDIELKPLQELAARSSQYQDAIPAEILDLLEEATETYTTLATTLPRRLQDTARKEIDFLISLYQESVRNYLPIQSLQTPQYTLRLACSV